MKSRRSFVLSIIDVITCALGAVLLLLIIELNRRHILKKERDAAVNQRDQMADQLAQAKVVQDHLEDEIERAQHDIARLNNENQRLAADKERVEKAWQTQAREVIGLQGPFNRVAFVFDTSGSMAERFSEHTALLSLWLRRLDFEYFHVISFDDAPTALSIDWQLASREARDRAAESVATLETGGGTATLAALKQVFQLPDLDTIVLFSDGNPTDAKAAEILEYVKKTNQQGIVINVIAMGDYFQQDYGTFLRNLAQAHGGQFLGC